MVDAKFARAYAGRIKIRRLCWSTEIVSEAWALVPGTTIVTVSRHYRTIISNPVVLSWRFIVAKIHLLRTSLQMVTNSVKKGAKRTQNRTCKSGNECPNVCPLSHGIGARCDYVSMVPALHLHDNTFYSVFIVFFACYFSRSSSLSDALSLSLSCFSISSVQG